jgi:hypothetical protein
VRQSNQEAEINMLDSQSEIGSKIDLVDDAYAEIDEFENRQMYRESFKRQLAPAKPQMKLSAKDGRVPQHYLQGI